MKDKMTGINKNIHKLKELWKNKQMRSILILGIYFIFFLLIIISLRTNHKIPNQVQENTSLFEFSTNKIKRNNYHYLYKVTLNNVTVTYEGDRYLEKEIFTKNDNMKIETFYNYHEKYLKNINQVWSKVENPYLFSRFKEITMIEKILKEANLESKTEYHNKSFQYVYRISTNNIVRMIDRKNIDIADIPNTITITTNQNHEVEKIELDLTSYLSYNTIKNQQLSISITYSKFGEIEEIEDPE